MKFISQSKIDRIGPVLLRAITAACQDGDETPSYADLVRYSAASGMVIPESDVSPVLHALEIAGQIKRIGQRARMIYRTAAGETVFRAQIPSYAHDWSPKGPSLEERAAMFGQPVALAHPSERPEWHDPKYPRRWSGSMSSRWASSLA